MKKISDTMQIGIAIVGLAIAYATFSKTQEDKGTGGSLNVPFDLSSLFGGGSGGAAVGTSQPAVSNSVQPSQTILDAMFAASQPKGANGTTWSSSAEKKAVSSAINTGGGVYVTTPSSKSGSFALLPVTDVGVTLPAKTGNTITSKSSYGTSGWSSISSYTSGSNVSKKSSSISPSGQSAKSVISSFNSGIRRGL